LPNGTFQLGRTGCRFTEITDGLSNTLLVGEKHVPLGHFGVGWWDCSLYNGDYYHCSTRPAGPGQELARDKNETRWCFGSYHPYVCQFAFGDGSVRSLPVTISGETLGLLANKADGQVIPDF
jgi:hypothetical protein